MADRNSPNRRKNLGLESSHGPNPDPDPDAGGSTNAGLDYDTAVTMWRFGSLDCGSVDGHGSTGSDATKEQLIPNSGIIDRTGPSNVSALPARITYKFRTSAPGYVDDRESVPCNDCSKEHPVCTVCPNCPRPCNICYESHFPYCACPYFHRIPQGATFNNNRYEIFCVCGNRFNEDRWACTSCGGSWAVLQLKYCSICNSRGQHSSHECPKDKVVAAQYKMIRDKTLLRVPIPYIQESQPSSELAIDPTVYLNWLAQNKKERDATSYPPLEIRGYRAV